MSPNLSHVSFTVHSHVLAAANLLAAKSTTKTNPLVSYGILVFFGLAIYFLVLRPRQRTRQRATQSRNAASVGDEVMLASGIIGRITSLEGDRATVEIAPEIEIEVVARSIAQVLVPAVQDDWHPDGDGVSDDPGAVHPIEDGEHDDDGDYDETDAVGDADEGAADGVNEQGSAVGGQASAEHVQQDLGAGQLSDASHPDSTTEQGRTS
jgi:preprotein translocase subunit YajC